jgi:hypothetical protein
MAGSCSGTAVWEGRARSVKELFLVCVVVFAVIIGICFALSGDPKALIGGGLAFIEVTGLFMFLAWLDG